MKLSELESKFRENVHDIAVPPFCSQATFWGYIIEGQDEACERKNLIYDRTTVAVCQKAVSEDDISAEFHASLFEVSIVYLDAGSNVHYPLTIVTKEHLEILEPDWRKNTNRPDKCIIDDKIIWFNSPLDADYTLRLEGYRVGIGDLSDDDHEPEIASIHHLNLLDWAYYQYYLTRDSDVNAPVLAAIHLKKFEDYFGEKPEANTDKNNQAFRHNASIFI